MYTQTARGQAVRRANMGQSWQHRGDRQAAAPSQAEALRALGGLHGLAGQATSPQPVPQAQSLSTKSQSWSLRYERLRGLVRCGAAARLPRLSGCGSPI